MYHFLLLLLLNTYSFWDALLSPIYSSTLLLTAERGRGEGREG
jgi:hypothetical protein